MYCKTICVNCFFRVSQCCGFEVTFDVKKVTVLYMYCIDYMYV